MTRTISLGVALAGAWLAAAELGRPPAAFGADPQQSAKQFKEPVFRVSRAKVDSQEAQQPHPLDAALDMARGALQNFRENVRDYTATVVKRERIGDKLMDYEYMYLKVRTRQFKDGKVVSPRCVYMYFLKPDSVKGREVIWLEGQNDNNMIAHEGGVKGRLLPTVWLGPESSLAMHNQRYPIYELGIENLLVRLIERGIHERQFDDVEVTFRRGAKVNGRVCTVLEVVHPVKREHFDYFRGRIFIDDELNLPIRYAAYLWPETPGGLEPVIEEYTYLDLKLNVGLTDADFDHRNPNYKFKNPISLDKLRISSRR